MDLQTVLSLLDKGQKEALVIEVISKHEIGCMCQMCTAIRARVPLAPANDADEFARNGGEHQTFPFDATNTAALQSIASSLQSIAQCADVLTSIVRGRGANGEKTKSALGAVMDKFLGLGQAIAPAPAPPQTQRTPPAQPQQTQPQALTKRVATDAEYQKMNVNQKITIDPKAWPGQPHKGRTLLQCEPQFLDVYADFREYSASESKKRIAAGTPNQFDEKTAKWGELDAAQYRRLAIEMRAGTVQRQAVAPTYAGGATSAADYD